MDVAILCPTSNGIAFVPAADTGGRPRYPYRCPACDTVVAIAAEHPGSLSVDDLLEFPFLLCGSTALLGRGGLQPVHRRHLLGAPSCRGPRTEPRLDRAQQRDVAGVADADRGNWRAPPTRTTKRGRADRGLASRRAVLMEREPERAALVRALAGAAGSRGASVLVSPVRPGSARRAWFRRSSGMWTAGCGCWAAPATTC